MKVSIIVPVYNVEEYIDRCFDSIMNQTYANIECIFVDDSSPDNCSKILEQRILEYSGPINFKIVKHEVNKGLSGARNTGTFAATGVYIYYLDSDDEITPDSIKILVELAKKYPGVDIVQGNTQTIPDPIVDWRNIIQKNYPEYVDDQIWIKKCFFSEPRLPVNAWNKLIKKSFLIKNNLLFREGIIHEDEHWMFYVGKKISTIAFTQSYCYVHYLVAGSIMQSGCNTKSIESWGKILDDISFDIDDSIATLQKRYIYGIIKYNMLRIDFKSSENKLAFIYRNIVRKKIVIAVKSIKIIECLFLSIFLMPHWIYQNFIGRKFTGLLMKFI